MVQTAEQKARIRYRQGLQNGKVPEPRKQISRQIREEVRAELAKDVSEGKTEIRVQAAKGVSVVQKAENKAVEHVKDAADAAEKKFAEFAAATAQKEMRKAAKRARLQETREASSASASASVTTPSCQPEPQTNCPASVAQEGSASIQPPHAQLTTAHQEATDAPSQPVDKGQSLDSERPDVGPAGTGALPAEVLTSGTPMTAEEALGEGRDQSLPEHDDPMALAVAELPTAAEPAGPEPLRQHVAEDLVLVPVGTEDHVHNAPAMLAHVPTTTLAHVPPAARPYHIAPMVEAAAEPVDHAKLREDAIQAERDRLAPEEALHTKRAYQRLASKHDWPALAEEVELPGGLKSRVAWFFKVNPRFKHALHTKWRDMARSAVTSTLAKQRETCSRCKHEQFLARDPFSYPFSERGTTFVWDACAQHRALTVTEEANIETDVRAEWAEEAVNAAVCAWRQQLDAEAKARRDNLARQEEAEADSERLREVGRQVRERLRPETRSCEMCMEADECIGGMCSLHESRFRALCMAASCGSAAKPTPAPLGRMLPLQS